jgi:RNA polymerase sigma-70 factor (ECF subfamily)
VEGPEPLTSDCLLPRIAGGDPSAVRECIARYGGLVWSLARRFLGNPADAEDAVQDVFVELWKNAAKFNPALSAETTFITMVARRRLIDRKRRTARMPMTAPLADEVAGRADFGERLTDLNDEAARAAAALGELRGEQQQVIRMAIYGGLTHEEISSATGMPLGTVKTHIRRGLLRIRELLGGGVA